MRIVHLGKFYPPESGGIESVTKTLSCGQAASGHQVDVVCFTQNEPRIDHVDGVVIHRFGVDYLQSSQPLGWRYFRLGLCLARDADIVHVHSPNLLASLMVCCIGRYPRVVLHWHSDIVGKGVLGRIVRPVEKAMLKRADAVIATSPTYLQESESLKSVKGKTHIIPIGIAPPLIAPLGEKQQQPGENLRRFIGKRQLVLGVGRLVPYKGFHHLIDAVPYLPENVAVIIAGDGPQRVDLQRQIDSRQLADRVLLAGKVDDEELEALFARAHVFCLPSVERSEAFGVVLLESMSKGIPAVTTMINGSGTAWVNAHEISGLNVPPGAPQALASACRRILEDTPLHSRLSKGALERFNALFTAQRFVRDVGALYEQVLSAHAA